MTSPWGRREATAEEDQGHHGGGHGAGAICLPGGQKYLDTDAMLYRRPFEIYPKKYAIPKLRII